MYRITFIFLALILLGGCEAEDGAQGKAGADGADGEPCTLSDNGDGTYTMSCPDGTMVVLSDGDQGPHGPPGDDGQPCTVTDNEDGTYTIRCPDGTTVTLADGDQGPRGEPGQDAQPCTVFTDVEYGTYTMTCPGVEAVTWSDGEPGPQGETGEMGETGPAGERGEPCAVTDNEDGTYTMDCPDGTSVTWSEGSSCHVVDNLNGSYTMHCPDGTSVTWTEGALCTVFENPDGTYTMTCPDGSTVTWPPLAGFELLYPGSFTMGSPPDEPTRDENERRVEVTITRPFYLKETPVTQGEWLSLMGNNPSSFSGCGAECPVERVNWWDAVAYCNALSRAEGLEECYTLTACSGTPGETDFSCGGVAFAGLSCHGYRLPTEAEWEYAYRAETTTAYYSGPLQETDCETLDANLDTIGWYCGNSADQPHPVALKEPNAWGLYDMAGNVWEWTGDWYGPYPEGPVADPEGPSSATSRVFRGGSFYDFPGLCRAAARNARAPGGHFFTVGFRPARTLP